MRCSHLPWFNRIKALDAAKQSSIIFPKEWYELIKVTQLAWERFFHPSPIIMYTEFIRESDRLLTPTARDWASLCDKLTNTVEVYNTSINESISLWGIPSVVERISLSVGLPNGLPPKKRSSANDATYTVHFFTSKTLLSDILSKIYVGLKGY